jgi:hypothetical protein
MYGYWKSKASARTGCTLCHVCNQLKVSQLFVITHVIHINEMKASAIVGSFSSSERPWIGLNPNQTGYFFQLSKSYFAGTRRPEFLPNNFGSLWNILMFDVTFLKNRTKGPSLWMYMDPVFSPRDGNIRNPCDRGSENVEGGGEVAILLFYSISLVPKVRPRAELSTRIPAAKAMDFAHPQHSKSWGGLDYALEAWHSYVRYEA